MSEQPVDRYYTSDYQYTPIDQAVNIAAKQRIIDMMNNLLNAPLAELGDVVRDSYHTDASVNVTHPVNELENLDGVLEKLWKPLRHAIPDVERRDYMVAGGVFKGAHWIGCMGYYLGTFENDWFGIPPTQGAITVRFSEGHELRDGKIVKSYVFIDFLDMMHQIGYSPIVQSLGSPMTWLPPATLDGVILSPQDNARSEQTIQSVLTMHRALGLYNSQPPTREVLDEMEMIKHWHKNFMWFGPAGIGTTRGLNGFEDYHQIPFLVAFPDRGGTDVGHFIRVGDGYYAVTGGWGYIQTTHTGNDFLGMPPTGKKISMRVMDFYRCDDDTIVENWIPIDIPHILLQMGVDVFARMRHELGRQRSAGMRHWLVP